MYNCKKNGKTAKLYVGIIQEISTTAKKIAQLQNQLYICKKNVLLALTTLLLLLILIELNMELNPIVLKSTLPRHPAMANKVATSRVPSHCLSCTTMPQSGTTYLVDRMPKPSLLSAHNVGEGQWSNVGPKLQPGTSTNLSLLLPVQSTPIFKTQPTLET